MWRVIFQRKNEEAFRKHYRMYKQMFHRGRMNVFLNTCRFLMNQLTTFKRLNRCNKIPLVKVTCMTCWCVGRLICVSDKKVQTWNHPKNKHVLTKLQNPHRISTHLQWPHKRRPSTAPLYLTTPRSRLPWRRTPLGCPRRQGMGRRRYRWVRPWKCPRRCQGRTSWCLKIKNP